MQADNKEIERLLKTARGQIDGLLKMIEDNRYCIDISNQILSTQALLGTINANILAAHLDHCVRHAFESGSKEEQDEKINEVLILLKRMNK